MKTPLLNACYFLDLQEDKETNQFSVNPLQKVGNQKIFDDLFFNKYPVKVRKLGPVKSLNDYVAHALRYVNSDKVQCQLVFETDPNLWPYGIVKSSIANNDCILFRVNAANAYEVFISFGNINQSAQLFTLFKEGLLNEDIDELLAVLQKLNEPESDQINNSSSLTL